MTPVASLPAAGRDLDALIAERVMGFAHGECRAAEEDIWISNDGLVWFQCPAYSTEIGAAWQVAEQIAKQGFWLSLELSPSLRTVEIHGYRLDDGDVTDLPGLIAETAPLAICRAALKALAP